MLNFPVSYCFSMLPSVTTNPVVFNPLLHTVDGNASHTAKCITHLVLLSPLAHA